MIHYRLWIVIVSRLYFNFYSWMNINCIESGKKCCLRLNVCQHCANVLLCTKEILLMLKKHRNYYMNTGCVYSHVVLISMRCGKHIKLFI